MLHDLVRCFAFLFHNVHSPAPIGKFTGSFSNYRIENIANQTSLLTLPFYRSSLTPCISIICFALFSLYFCRYLLRYLKWPKDGNKYTQNVNPWIWCEMTTQLLQFSKESILPLPSIPPPPIQVCLCIKNCPQILKDWKEVWDRKWVRY